MVLKVTSCGTGKPSLHLNFVAAVCFLECMSVFSNGGCLTLEHNFSSGPQASWGDPSHQSSFLPSVRTSATQTRAEWWLLHAEWQASHMLCRELFSLLNFHIFKGSLKAISVTIVSRSSCIASPELSVTAGLFSDRLQRAQGQSFTNVELEICSRKKPSAIQLVSLGACVTFYPNFDWSLSPRDNLPSHLPFIQTQPSTHQAAAALSSVSLTGFHRGKVKWQCTLFLNYSSGSFLKSLTLF